MRSPTTTLVRTAYERALAIEPRHELARLALAQMDEAQNRCEAAIERYQPLAVAHPENVIIVSSLARSLRKAGRPAQAKSVLEPLASQPDVVPMVAPEMFSIELERGNYPAARDWFERSATSHATDEGTVTAAAVMLSMLGETIASDRLLTWMFDRREASSFVEDLQAHVAVHPQDATSAAQLQKAIGQLSVWSATESPYQTAVSAAAADQQREPPGRQLYLQHCSACHGIQGDGNGCAARHLFPRPRNLPPEPMRLVSTHNGVPTRDDVRAVIKSGVPGTAMVPLEKLAEPELDLLVDVVLTMRREGVREQYVAQLKADDEEPVDADVNDVVQLRTTPGARAAVPEMGQPDKESLVLGKQLYVQQACPSCHGETGTGDQTMPLFDAAGRPDFPRDLVHDVFKGGNTLEPICLRILLGMPGTPHPANVNMSTQQLTALTHYCHSMGDEPKHTLTNHQRAVQASRRPAVQWSATTTP